jgi:hypothetical protein
MPLPRTPLVLVSLLAFSAACDQTSEECAKKLDELQYLCPVGSAPHFRAKGEDNGAGGVDVSEWSGDVEYASEGSCEVACVPAPPCPCGKKWESRDQYECFPISECAPGCGDGVCADQEDVSTCGRDCAVTMTAGPDGGAGPSGGDASTDVPVGPDGEGCVKLARHWYVVRTDGKLLVEHRDQTETVVGDVDGRPLQNVTDVTAGAYHGCALLADHTVWCWRENLERGNWVGQLGNGATDTDQSQPLLRASKVLVDAGQALADVKQLTAGSGSFNHTCAITSKEELYCWGDLKYLVNNGQALASPYAVPITTNGIDPLQGVLQASASSNMACAVVKGAGANEVYCWGANDYYNLGTGNTTRQQYPTKLTALTNPSRVTVKSYGYALSSGGTGCAVDGEQVRCWGANGTGEGGVGMPSGVLQAPSPVVLMDNSKSMPAPVEMVSDDGGRFCALLSNKAIWCWGAGYQAYASGYGVTNVALLGGLWGSTPLFVTTDGRYHWGMEWARSPNCGSL